MRYHQQIVSTLSLSLCLLGSSVQGQEKTAEKNGVSAATIAEYEALGGSFFVPVDDNGIWGWAEEPGSLPAFVFFQKKLSDWKLPMVKVPFALFLSQCEFEKDRGLKSLAHLKNLRTLGLNFAPVTDEDLKELAPLDLTTLILIEPKVTDAGFKHLAALKNLKTLRMSNVKIKGAGLKDLAPLTKLTTLNLRCTDLTADGLKTLAQVTSLTTLDLHSSKIGDAGLKELAPLKSLTTLNLTSTNITDKGLVHLQPLTNLTTLKLSSNYKMLNKGLDHLACLEKLSSLDLSYTLLSDTGLKKLEQFKNLTSLNIYECHSVSREGIDQFKKALPKCKVYGSRFKRK